VSFALTDEQQKACDAAVDYVRAGDYVRPFICSGLAGVGKTVTLGAVWQALRDAGAKPAVCAPTGKAASVINRKFPDIEARTIHKTLSKRPFDSLELVWKEIAELEAAARTPEVSKKLRALYTRVETAAQGRGQNLFFQPIEADDFYAGGNDCLIVDEASMVGRKEIFDKLMAHLPVPMLFFGDSGQLPPVNDVAAFNLANPNVKLTKILRQGDDSGIIPFCYSIAQRGEYLTSSRYPDVELIGSSSPLAVEPYLPDHQIDCWMNETRWKIAPMVRKARGFIPNGEYPFLPQIGETLLVDKNDYQRDLLRGEPLKVADIIHDPSDNPYVADAVCVTEDGIERPIRIDMSDLAGSKKFFMTKDGKDEYHRAHATKRGLKVQFDGVITAHKAQGSEWEKVLYYGDMYSRHEDWKRHAYTGCTRARTKLTVVAAEFKGRI
jgi:exodeoxyribonuclease-5